MIMIDLISVRLGIVSPHFVRILTGCRPGRQIPAGYRHARVTFKPLEPQFFRHGGN
jgi:hypothetical protein